MPGGAPYVRSAEDLEAFMARIERFLEFFMTELKGQASNPLALRQMLGGDRSGAPGEIGGASLQPAQ